jgi:hypothetical protein
VRGQALSRFDHPYVDLSHSRHFIKRTRGSITAGVVEISELFRKDLRLVD